jgi:hypothetical protein
MHAEVYAAEADYQSQEQCGPDKVCFLPPTFRDPREERPHGEIEDGRSHGVTARKTHRTHLNQVQSRGRPFPGDGVLQHQVEGLATRRGDCDQHCQTIAATHQ